MSTNENTPLPDDSSNFQLIGPPQPPPQNMSKYLHALRRHWLMATGIGLLCAAVLGPAVWLSFSKAYTASSYFRVASREPIRVFQTVETGRGQTEFDIYKATQRQLMSSQFVLVSALRKPEISTLPIVQHQDDEIAWLSEQLKVTFPGEAEIMEVSVTTDNPGQAAALVNAVVEAYLSEVVEVDRNRRRRRLSDLERISTEKETEVRRKRSNLRQLAEQLGTLDSEALRLKQQIALQQYGSFAKELVQMQFQLRRATGTLKVQQALLRTVDVEEIPEYELSAFAQTDPVARQLLAELAWRRKDVANTEAVTVPGAVSAYAERFRRDLQSAEQQYDSLGEELRGNLRDKRRAEGAAKIKQLGIEIAALSEQTKLFEQDVEEKRKAAERFGGSSLDVEMMQVEIDQHNKVLGSIASERERLRVEVDSASRITLLQRAEPPRTADRTGRLALAVFAMIVGFCIPAGCIAWWDTRGQRINVSEDISEGLGLPVSGLVPVIPARVNRESGSRTQRYQKWEGRITESVNGIAARLLHQADTKQTHVMLITSAVRGEGKTSLATRLAVSLARSGHSTVVVDFDLRHPGVHEAFGLDLGTGVSEVLRQQNEVAEVIHHIGADKPSVVTAGRLDNQALVSLAKGAAEPLLEKLREDYEFVLIDASPVLDVADAQFVSRHVDSAVLSVFRDISQARKVSRARETLEEYVQTVEAVVTSPR